MLTFKVQEQVYNQVSRQLAVQDEQGTPSGYQSSCTGSVLAGCGSWPKATNAPNKIC